MLFEEIKTIGEYLPEEIAAKLQQIDDPDMASNFLERADKGEEFANSNLKCNP
jgi:predicted DNA-binding protein